MAFKGELVPSGEPEFRLRKTARGSRPIPQVEGQTVHGKVNVEEIVLFLRQIEEDHANRKLRHRGRDGSGGGKRNSRRQEVISHRHARRRGSWKS
jgi:hypothetical protein